MKYYFLFFFAFLLVDCSAQTLESTDSTLVRVDTSETLKPKKKFIGRAYQSIFKSKYPNPKRAALLSLAVPGLGQVYNKKYWKVPLVYAGIGGLVYAINWNGTEYRRFRTAYRQRVDGDPETIDEFAQVLTNAEAVRNWRDRHYKNFQLSWIGFFAVWTLNSVDAFVDAHLLTFNVSDDLSLQVDPLFQQNDFGTMEMGFSFKLGKAKERRQKFY